MNADERSQAKADAVTQGQEPEWLTVNRALWDEWAAAHAESAFYDLQGMIGGRNDLRPWEPAEVGPVDGKRLVHLQCHIGTDTLDWARRGAQVTALDFSSRALRTVKAMASWAGVSVTCVEADVYSAVEAVGTARFDIVYTGMGALNWLPNLDRWAQVVRRLLEPGGFLYLYEIHPLVAAMSDDGKGLAEDLFAASFVRYENGIGSYAAPTREFENTVAYERVHGMGELFTALIDAGLSIESFREFDRTPAPRPFLERGPDGLFRLPSDAVKFPLSFSLKARRPS